MNEVVVRHAKREEDDEQLGLCMHIKDYSIVSRSLCLARFVSLLYPLATDSNIIISRSASALYVLVVSTLANEQCDVYT